MAPDEVRNGCNTLRKQNLMLARWFHDLWKERAELLNAFVEMI
jgi:hypothetical protein